MRPETAPAAAVTEPRRHDLDWLRASVFLLLILYHVGMFFVPWSWHIKNPQPAGPWLQVPMFVVSQWRLSLLFLVSGAAVHFALGRRSCGEFVRERFGRLFVPLVFGMLVVVPPQVYYERLTQGAAYASYLAFLPDAYSGGPYPAGNVSWHHLWFVLYALVFALLALPLFQALRPERAGARLAACAAWFQRPGRILLLALPVIISEVTLRPAWPSTHTLIGDWANVVSYFIIFVYGYVLYSVPGFGAALEAQRRTALVPATVATGALVLVWQAGHAPAAGYTAGYLCWLAVKALNSWCWVAAVAGYARRYLNVHRPILRRANEAVYPFYILHQTVIVGIAYHLTDWGAPVPLKFAVIAAGTLLVTTALYVAIRTHPLTRLLFGMKPRPAAAFVAARGTPRQIRVWR